MKTFLFTLLFMTSSYIQAQTLEKMQWFNEPEHWEIKGEALTMFVTPHSDYWRISHYGFTVDDAPFYYTTYGGEFEAKVKITETIRFVSTKPDSCYVLIKRITSKQELSLLMGSLT